MKYMDKSCKNKYYDRSRNRFLSEADGCKYEDWGKSDDFSFAIHPKGFRVFLSPSQLEKSDEYSENDPYTVEQNIDSEFHKRRIDATIYLLKIALGECISNPKILDIGCGEGHITADIQKSFLDAELSGLDYSISAINYAVEKFPGIDFCVADAHNPPYCDDYFDVVVLNNLWEHIPDPLLLLKGIRRILKDRGYLILSTPSRYRLSNLLNVLRGKPAVLMSAHHVTEYSVGQVIEQLRCGGVEVEKVYSKPIRNQSRGIRSIIAHQVILPILRTYLKIIGSHHSLETTVFFLASKKISGD